MPQDKTGYTIDENTLQEYLRSMADDDPYTLTEDKLNSVLEGMNAEQEKKPAVEARPNGNTVGYYGFADTVGDITKNILDEATDPDKEGSGFLQAPKAFFKSALNLGASAWEGLTRVLFDPKVAEYDIRRSGGAGLTKKEQERTYEILDKASEERAKESYRTGIERRKAIEELLPNETGYEDSFWFSQVPAGFGSAVGYMGMTALTGGGGYALGALGQGQEMGIDTYEATRDVTKANAAFAIGLPIGATEAIPVNRMFNRIGKLAGKPAQKMWEHAIIDRLKDIPGKPGRKIFKSSLINALAEGSEETIQEAFQTIAENATARELYDTTRSLTEGVAEGGAVGFITGATLGGAGHAIRHKLSKNKTPLTEEETSLLNKALEDVVKFENQQINKVRQQTISPDSYTAEDVANTLNSVLNFGKGNDIGEGFELTPEETNALNKTKANEGTIIANAMPEIINNPKSNFVDDLLTYGKHGYKMFIDNLSQEYEDVDVYTNAIKEDKLLNLNQDEQHTIAKEVYNKALGSAYDAKLYEQFNDYNGPIELEQDALVTMMMNSGDTGLNLLRQRWEGRVAPDLLRQYTDRIKEVDVTDATPLFNYNLKETLRNQAKVVAQVNNKHIRQEDEHERTKVAAHMQAQRGEDLFIYHEEQGQIDEPTTNTFSKDLTGFVSGTFQDTKTFLEDKGIFNERTAPMAEFLSKIVGDIKVAIKDIGVDEKGRPYRGSVQFNKETWAPEIIYINPSALKSKPSDVFDTLMHEGVHALTIGFLKQNSREAKLFRGKIEGFISEVKHVLNNPNKINNLKVDDLNMTKEQFVNRVKAKYWDSTLQYDLSSPEEFIASIFSDTSPLRDIMVRIQVGGQEVKTKGLYGRVIDAIKEGIKTIAGIVDNNLLDSLGRLMDRYSANIASVHIHRWAQNTPSFSQLSKEILDEKAALDQVEDYNNALDEIADALDEYQISEDDMESYSDEVSTGNFIHHIALGTGRTKEELYKALSKSTRTQIEQSINNLNTSDGGVTESRIRDLHKSLKKYEPDYDTFRRRFITRLAVRMSSLRAREFLSFKTVVKGGQVTTAIDALGTNFQTPQGAKTTSFRPSIVLDSMLKPLEKMLGLNPNTLGISFINDFSLHYGNPTSKARETSSIDKVSVKTLASKDNDTPVHFQLAKAINAANPNITGKKYIFLGNFGGNRTVPVISYPANEEAKIRNVLGKFAISYGKLFTGENVIAPSEHVTDANATLTMTTRMLVEDMWAGALKIDEAGNISSFDTTFADGVDWNKLQKRGTRLIHGLSNIEESPDFLQSIFPNSNFSGIIRKNVKDTDKFGNVVEKNKLVARAAIFNTGDEGSVTVNINGEDIQVPLIELLINAEGDPVTDGASFYIIEEFDKIYREVHGLWKQGALKNVLSSKFGEPSLFIKHAMHGVHRDSLLGKIMVKNNLALLVSDQSAKMGANNYGVHNLTDLSQGTIREESKIIEVPLSHFSRIKEEHNTKLNGGALKQLLNGSGFVSVNPAVSEELLDQVLFGKDNQPGLVDKILDNVDRNVYNVTSADLLESVRAIAANPSPSKEEALATSLKDILKLSDEEILDRMKPILNHPLVSEQLRAMLNRRLKDILGGKIAGIRAALEPSVGHLNAKAQVEPIYDNWNLRNHILALPEEDSIFKAAIPEVELRPVIKEIVKLQKAITWMHSNGETSIGKIEEMNNRITELKDFIQSKADEIGASYIKPKLFTAFEINKRWRELAEYFEEKTFGKLHEKNMSELDNPELENEDSYYRAITRESVVGRQRQPTIDELFDLLATWYGVPSSAFQGREKEKLFPYISRKENYIDLLEIPEGHRSKGIGRKIYELIEDEIKREGYDDVFLLAEPESVKFWEKLGFEIETKVKDEGESNVMMRKSFNIAVEQEQLTAYQQFKKARLEKAAKSPLSIIDTENTKVKDYISKLPSKIIDERTGRLKKGYCIITEDIANAYGLKPGDKLVTVITPTDSLFGVTSVVVGAVIKSYNSPSNQNRRVSDVNKIIMNSEYIQSRVGKDFDIDTVSIIPYDPRFWSQSQFEVFNNLLNEVAEAYPKEMVKAFNSAFAATGARPKNPETNEDIPINEQTIFNKATKEIIGLKYAQVKNGATIGSDKFSPWGYDFFRVLDNYTSDKSLIINARVRHTALTAIDFKLKKVAIPQFNANGDVENTITEDLNIRNPKWMETHLMHLRWTNDEVDFPGNTNKIFYNSDLRKDSAKLANFDNVYNNNLSKLPIEDKALFASTLDDVIKLLFGASFDIASNRQLSDRSSATYYDQILAITYQKGIFNLLESDNKLALYEMYASMLDQRWDKAHGAKPDTKQAIERKQHYIKLKTIAKEIFNSLSIGKLDDYPLFNTIKNIDTTRLSIPGTSFLRHLMNENVTMRKILESYGPLAEIYNLSILTPEEIAQHKKTFFTDPKGGFYANRTKTGAATTNSAEALFNPDLWSIAASLLPRELDFRKGRKGSGINSLETTKKIAVSIAIAAKELDPSKTSTVVRGELASNQEARTYSYPKLFELMLGNPSIFFNPEETRALLQDKVLGNVILTGTSTGELRFNVGNEYVTHTQVANRTSELASKIRDRFTSVDGIFSTPNNRFNLDKLITLGNNVPVEARRTTVNQFIVDNLYGNKNFDLTDQQAFWISSITATSVEASKDMKALTFMPNRNVWTGENPLEFQYNNLLLQLMADNGERDLLYQYWETYANVQATEVTLEEDQNIGTLKEGTSPAEIFYNRGTAPNGEDFDITMTQFFNSQLSKIDKSSMIAPQLLSFRKTLKSKGKKEAYKELMKLIDDVSMLQALAESHTSLENIAHDIKAMPYNKFEQKYLSKTTPLSVEAAFNRLLEHYNGWANNFLERNMQREENKMQFIYWSLLQIKREALYRKEKMDEFKSGLRNGMTHAVVREQRSMQNPETIVGYTYDIESGGFKNINAREVSNLLRTEATTTPIPFGHALVAHAKKEAVTAAMLDIVTKSSEKIQQVDRIVNLITNEKSGGIWDRLRGVSYRDNFIVENTGSDGKLKTSSPLYKYILELLSDLDNKQLDKFTYRQKVFDLAENMRAKQGITIFEEAGKIMYTNAQGKVWGDIKTFIEENAGVGLPSEVKLQLLAALEYRKVYDIIVPKALASARNYLNQTFLELISLGDKVGARSVQVLMNKYDRYLRQQTNGYGNYMPHHFPANEYKILWQLRERTRIEIEVNKEIAQAHELKRKGEILAKAGRPSEAPAYNVELALLTKNTPNYEEKRQALINKRIADSWTKHQKDFTGTSVITNFLERKLVDDVTGYSKTDIGVHYTYFNKLTDGIKEDLLTADSFQYLANARRVGEDPAIMHEVYDWYGTQLRNPLFKTEPINKKNLRPGMKVNFLHRAEMFFTGDQTPLLDEISIYGTVKKVTKDSVILGIDEAEMKYKIDRQRKFYERINNNILDLPVNGPMTMSQLATMNNLIGQGYLTRSEVIGVENLTLKEASKIILGGLNRVLADPSKVATYKLSDIYTKNIDGSANYNEVGRYIKPGIEGYLNTRAREIENVYAMEGKYDQAVYNPAYLAWKLAGDALEKGSRLARTITSLTFMGGIVGVPAYALNWIGGQIAMLAESPVTNFRLRGKGKAFLKSVMSRDPENLTEGERELYDHLSSLGLMSDNAWLALALEKVNLSAEEVLAADEKEGFFSAAFSTYKLFNDASGYKDYKDKLDQLRLDYTNAALKNQKDKSKELLKEIYFHNLDWKAKVNGLLSGGSHTEEELNKARAEIVKMIKEGKDLKANIAEDRGITRSMIVQMAMKNMWKGYMKSWLGVGLQGKAEPQLRRLSYMIGYYKALEAGHDTHTAMKAGENATEWKNALYGPASKQKYAAQSALGSFFLQFVQYSYNSFTKLARRTREMIGQALINEPQSIKEKANYIFSSKIDFAERIPTEVGIEHVKTNGIDKQDINIMHSNMMKWISTYIMAQLGVRVFYGLGNFQDPAFMLMYEVQRLISKIAAGDFPSDDEDDDISEIFWLLGQTLFMIGLPAKLMLSFAKDQAIDKEYEGLGSFIPPGKPSKQIRFLDRAIATADALADASRGDRVKTKDWNRTLLDTKVLDEMLGIRVFGTARTARADNEYEVESPILGEYTIKMRKPESPVEYGKKDFVPAEVMLLELGNITQSYIPNGDVLLPEFNVFKTLLKQIDLLD